MTGKLLWVPLVSGLVLIANFIVLMKYGDTLQSTHLFIVRGTVFYPLAWLNLIVGVILIALVIRGWVSGNQK